MYFDETPILFPIGLTTLLLLGMWNMFAKVWVAKRECP
jgi:hypothetical protein